MKFLWVVFGWIALLAASAMAQSRVTVGNSELTLSYTLPAQGRLTIPLTKSIEFREDRPFPSYCMLASLGLGRDKPAGVPEVLVCVTVFKTQRSDLIPFTAEGLDEVLKQERISMLTDRKVQVYRDGASREWCESRPLTEAASDLSVAYTTAITSDIVFNVSALGAKAGVSKATRAQAESIVREILNSLTIEAPEKRKVNSADRSSPNSLFGRN